MSKKILSIISLLLAMVMLLGTLASCTGNGNQTDDTNNGSGSSESTESNGTESGFEGDTDESDTENGGGSDDTDSPQISGDNAELIELSNKLSNGVSPYYTDSTRNELTISNTQVDLGYNMTHGNGDMLVSHLSDKNGNRYISNTMDVFIKMKDGKTYYTSKTADNGSLLLNIYRYGYYYYENRIEGLSFINEIVEENTKEIKIKPLTSANHGIEIQSQKIENGVAYKVVGSDPYIVLNGISFPAAEYDYLEITIKAENVTSASELYLIAGSNVWYSSNQVLTFGLATDGEAHTYRLPISTVKDYTGTVKGIRFDINAPIGSTIEISDLKVYKGSYAGSPEDLTVQRSFLTYSDKLHHLFQISAEKDTADVKEIGMITQIDANTVNGIVVKDIQGLHYDLNKIHWNSAEYVGFDIKGAGIFGYILPNTEDSGKLKVTLEDGVYTITQSIIWDKGILTPSLEGTRNKNDFFMGQRIYTDSNHTFDTFIKEADCERNPLTDENIEVDIYNSDSASFAGYDALRGYYKFTVAGTGFNQAYYKYPNKHYSIKFSVKGDEYDRQMYFMSYTPSGNLESAVLLDDKQMLLPVPMEVAKNFAGDGENTIYNLDDASYGEVFFPMIVHAEEKKAYTIVNLYQNWGKVPLKQLSSIQFHTPYYHLSTGVTETNCIVPFAIAGPALPDFRGMSAPFWKNQPQHNSAGGHAWLRYTDSEGSTYQSNTTGVHIDSYGPTYADISLDFASDDGKIEAVYTHIEMPQTDENRSYYEIKYTITEDLSISDFRNKFTLYSVTDNCPNKEPTGPSVYEKIGYLDENNQYQVADAANSGEKLSFVLGKECPYFSFFMMPNYYRDNPHAEGYSNVAVLIYNYEVVINGEKIDTNFYLHNSSDTLYLTLDLDEVNFKAGDTITINAILLPWGSQTLEDGIIDVENGNFEYDMVVDEATGELYMDKNVRDVRENTLLNPLKASADKDCEVIKSVFIPKVKTTNGKTAEFTLSGGHNNCTVRVYGFDMLTVPYVEEFVDGEWKEYKLSSADSPDMYGYSHYYDGYMVHYDGDGTYSYSFVAPMDNGAPRKFRISATEEFKGWPSIEDDDDIIEDPINFFLQPKEILLKTSNSSGVAGAILAQNKHSLSLFGHAYSLETFMSFFSNNGDEKIVTGQYVVVKYRIPTGMNNLTNFEFFTTTDPEAKEATESHKLSVSAITDNNWHVLIINLADACREGVFVPNDNGEYVANFVRWDFLNNKVSADMYIDVAYFGLHDNLEEIYAMEINKEIVPSDTPLYVEVVEGGKTLKIDPKTGKEYIPTYVAEDSGYTVSDVDYFAWIDFVNRTGNSFGMANNMTVPEKVTSTGRTTDAGLLVLTGWCVAEGGIEKYVWSADGGKTWHDVVMYNNAKLQDANEDMFKTFKFRKGYSTFSVPNIGGEETVIKALDPNTDYKANGGFQGGSGICADLMNYFEQGDTVNVTFAAVPKADTDSLCIIGHIKNVTVYVAPEVEPNATINVTLTPEAIKDLYVKKPNFSVGISGMDIISEEGGYLRVHSTAGKGDSYATVMSGNTQNTGKYLFIKYRIPTGYSSLNQLEVFTSTVNAHFVGNDSFRFEVIQDNEWHVAVIDLSNKLNANVFAANSDGYYIAKYLRVDFFNEAPKAGMYIDIASIGYADNLNVIYKNACSGMKHITLITDKSQLIDPKTGLEYVPVYVDPENEQGYTTSTVSYGAYIDMINGRGGNRGGDTKYNKSASINSAVPVLKDTVGTTLEGTYLLTFSGWAVAEGGIEKYVWSADGGKTWHDVQLYKKPALDPGNADYLKVYTQFTGNDVIDMEATKVNVRFQSTVGGGAESGGIAADLTAYAGQTVNVTFAAVPKADTSSLCVLVHVEGIVVPAAENSAE